MAAKVYCANCGYERVQGSASRCRHCYRSDAAEDNTRHEVQKSIGTLLEEAYRRGFKDGSNRVRAVVLEHAKDALQMREKK